jgi:hypothetical protein
MAVPGFTRIRDAGDAYIDALWAEGNLVHKTIKGKSYLASFFKLHEFQITSVGTDLCDLCSHNGPEVLDDFSASGEWEPACVELCIHGIYSQGGSYCGHGYLQGSRVHASE